MSLLVGEHSTDAEVGAHGTVKFLDYLSLCSSGLCCFEPPGRLVLSWGVCKGFVPERLVTLSFTLSLFSLLSLGSESLSTLSWNLQNPSLQLPY